MLAIYSNFLSTSIDEKKSIIVGNFFYLQVLTKKINNLCWCYFHLWWQKYHLCWLYIHLRWQFFLSTSTGENIICIGVIIICGGENIICVGGKLCILFLSALAKISSALAVFSSVLVGNYVLFHQRTLYFRHRTLYFRQGRQMIFSPTKIQTIYIVSHQHR